MRWLPVSSRLVVACMLLVVGSGLPPDARGQERLEIQRRARRVWRVVAIVVPVIATLIGVVAGTTCRTGSTAADGVPLSSEGRQLRP